MLEKILVPDIGEYSNVEIIGIAVATGDTIEKDDELITLETDKATMEIPAPKAGTVQELLVKIGDKVSKGTPILTLKENLGANTAANKMAVPAPTAVSATIAASSVQDLLLPDIGSDQAAAIIELIIKPGMVISKDATLLTLESDKASMDVPSTHSGTIKEVLVKVGDSIKTGAKIATIETSGASTPVASVPAPAPAAPPTRTPTPTTETRSSSSERRANNTGLPYAGPGVRRFARELGVDLTKVSGTGRKDRIMQTDVQGYVKKTLAQISSGSVTGSGLNISPAPVIDFAQFGAIESKPLNRIQKISGAFLHRNWVTIPHVTHFEEADITELEFFRKNQKELAEKQGLKLTPLVFLMKAAVAGLKQFPKFNSSLAANGEDLIFKQYFNIGVAVDTPNGLVVPVVRNVDQKGLFELAADLGVISKKARDGKLTGADMQGGCFTISSLGGIGGISFTPIINAPEVAILGVSKAQMKPIYTENEDGQSEFKPRLMLPLSLSYDHRVIDGADAARFASFLANLLTDIRRLLL